MGTLLTETSPSALQERLRDPATVAALNRLLDRADTLEGAMDRLDALLLRLPAALGTLTDVADDAYRRASASGVDLDARAQGGLQLLGRLSEPRTLEAVGRLLERLDQLDRGLELTDRLPALVATVVDSADDFMRAAAAEGIDVERGLLNGAGAALRFGAMMGPEQLDSLEALLHSGVLAPRTVEVIAGVGRALTNGAAEPRRPIGPVGLVRALREPDVQRALGFLVQVARHFGRVLAEPETAGPAG
jgi:hypothetical protein